jgi:DNA-binding beta-propeller fold protein YncE
VQKHSAILGAATAAAAISLLSACSGAGPQGASSTIPGSGISQSLQRSDLSRSGISPKHLAEARLLQALGHGVNPAKKKKGGELFVSDFGTGAVEILANKTWTNKGSITSGISGPDGNWVDKKGNLYVANYEGVDITEYAKGSTSPSHTYSGVEDPVGVTTDSSENVYEADFEGGYVAEFAQGSNSIIAQCSPGGDVEGIAVDKSGNVFVAYVTESDTGKIAEYKGGLSGCSETPLSVSLEFPGGMVLDKKANLVVCDQDAEAVDIIAPPYSSVTKTLGSGYDDPFHVTINKKNKQAYVANNAGENVFVLSYPSGSLKATLNSSNGLSDPAAAVDSANYNP